LTALLGLLLLLLALLYGLGVFNGHGAGAQAILNA